MTALPSRDETQLRGGGQVAGRFIIKPAPPREPPFDDEFPTRHLNLVGPHDRPLPFAKDAASDPTLRLVESQHSNEQNL